MPTNCSKLHWFVCISGQWWWQWQRRIPKLQTCRYFSDESFVWKINPRSSFFYVLDEIWLCGYDDMLSGVVIMCTCVIFLFVQLKSTSNVHPCTTPSTSLLCPKDLLWPLAWRRCGLDMVTNLVNTHSNTCESSGWNWKSSTYWKWIHTWEHSST